MKIRVTHADSSASAEFKSGAKKYHIPASDEKNDYDGNLILDVKDGNALLKFILDGQKALKCRGALVGTPLYKEDADLEVRFFDSWPEDL